MRCRKGGYLAVGIGAITVYSDIGPALKPLLRELGSVRSNAGTATDIHQNPPGRSDRDPPAGCRYGGSSC